MRSSKCNAIKEERSKQRFSLANHILDWMVLELKRQGKLSKDFQRINFIHFLKSLSKDFFLLKILFTVNSSSGSETDK